MDGPYIFLCMIKSSNSVKCEENGNSKSKYLSDTLSVRTSCFGGFLISHEANL